MSDNPLLEDIRTKVEARVKQLDADIVEARTLLEKYEAERLPLIRILAAMGVVNPLEEIAADIKAPAPAPKVAVVSPPADDIPEDEKNDGMGDPAFNPSGTPLKPHRWSHFSIPPRHRKFLDKFGHQEFVTRKEIKEWYLDEVNPMIQPASLLTNISHLFRTLSDKGILARKLDGTEGTDDEVWRFIRNNT